MPICVTRSCNNYGPNQNEEKLIPKIINALQNRSDIPIYGDGTQIRQWIHVQDHVEAILQVMLNGINGKIYNIGDENYISNIELAKKICYLYDKKIGLSDFQSQKLIKLLFSLVDVSIKLFFFRYLRLFLIINLILG